MALAYVGRYATTRAKLASYLGRKLRERGWLIPAYTMPADCEQMAVLRFVIRAGFSRDMAEQLLLDIQRSVQWFESLSGPMPQPQTPEQHFHH